MQTLETLVCPHFGICGGCACRPAVAGPPAPPPYAEELLAKEARVRTLLSPFDVGEWRPILPSPEAWFYRNKMEFAFAVGWDLPPTLVLGQRQAGRFDRVVDLESCLLMSRESSEVLTRVRDWAKSNGLTGYHRKRHEGNLRYLVVREGKNTEQRMIVLIATAPFDLDMAPFQALISPLVTTAWLGKTNAVADNARADDMQLLWGPGTIEERLGDVRFQISPFSFFQTNTRGTETLYALLKTWGSEQGGALIDLYCGSGGIGLSLAKSFDRVIGIDTNRDAIQDAVRTAERNGIQNAEFVCEDALEFLKKLPASKLSVQQSAMIIDPPRPGLHPKALTALLELNPPRLAYVSCNPESLARDLQSLAPLYRIQSAQPVDLFPHTVHVETVVFMEHR